MTVASRAQPEPGLRASDADRDAVVAELSEHYQAGRLRAEEFDDRSGRALSARTGQDLADLLADLPTVSDDRPAASRRPGMLYLLLLAAGVAVAASVAVSVGTAGHVRVDFLPWWLVAAAFLGWRRWVRR